MKPKRILAALLLLTAGLQNATGQKLTLHMAGNQVAEYDLTQLDSLVFSEVTSWGSGSESTNGVRGYSGSFRVPFCAWTRTSCARQGTDRNSDRQPRMVRGCLSLSRRLPLGKR